MILTVSIVVPDDLLAQETADKLLGRFTTVQKMLSEKLALEIFKRGIIKYEQVRDPVSYNTIIRAYVVVGQEHVVTHKMETPVETDTSSY